MSGLFKLNKSSRTGSDELATLWNWAHYSKLLLVHILDPTVLSGGTHFEVFFTSRCPSNAISKWCRLLSAWLSFQRLGRSWFLGCGWSVSLTSQLSLSWATNHKMNVYNYTCADICNKTNKAWLLYVVFDISIQNCGLVCNFRDLNVSSFG